MKKETRLISMDEIISKEIDWLWHPYIPFGKVTILQGDPGEGKTSFALALMALLTTGSPLPQHNLARKPINVIFQTAEDGLADTIKPRLESYGADCSRVLVIDEAESGLTLSDERLEDAVVRSNARLVVLDPIQAYLGSGVDMHRANEVRPLFKQLCSMAERTGCAVILIGHMNKDRGGKALYRGLGSIDFSAAVRSILVVGRSREEPSLRIAAHAKSNLAPEGKSIAFELGENCTFNWHGYCDTTVDELLSGTASVQTKTAQMEQELRKILVNPMPAHEVYKHAKSLGISERTLKTAKSNLRVKSFKLKGQWMWCLAS
ncbi:MAG: AAA family ATPase [Oscillospiraceae bacterium]|nr:AAA family ATPase [Oscillospiraceae bacterium]